MKLQWKKVIAAGVAVALCVSGVAVPTTEASAATAKKVTLNKKKIVLYKGADKSMSTFKLKVTVKPKSAKVSWKSADKKVATVTKKGLVKAKKAGTTKITVQSGKKKAVCKVTVKKITKKVKKVTVAKKSLTLAPGATAKIKATVTPKKATLKKVSYKSADKAVAKVNKSGKVTAVAAGTTKITVTALDGSKKKATVKVTVTEPAVEPTAAPTAEPTVEPTAEPTVAPTVEPTAEPTAEPTVEPTVEPTAEPTATPTVAPTPTPGYSGGGIGGGTTTPTATPTPAPLTTEVKGTTDAEGNTTYALDGETQYKITATFGGKEYDLTSNDSTVSYVTKVVGYLDTTKSITELCDTFENKALENSTFVLAEDTAVTVNKEAGSNSAKLTIDSSDSAVAGEYDLTLSEAGGICSVNAVKNADNYTAFGLVKNTDGSYTISNMVCVQNGVEKELSMFPGKTANTTVVVNGDTTTVTCVAGSETVVMTFDGESGYSIKLPESYIEKYQLKILK